MLKVLIGIGIGIIAAVFLVGIFACLKAASDADDEMGAD